MSIDTATTRADQLEADCRHAMATLPPATWQHREQRRDDLAILDARLDEFNDEIAGR